MSVRVYGKYYPLISFLMSCDEDIFVPVLCSDRFDSAQSFVDAYVSAYESTFGCVFNIL